MIATENRTNNGKRLVAAVAIFAMIACCLAIVVPADDVSAVVVEPEVSEGTYENVVGPNEINTIADLEELADDNGVIFIGAAGATLQLNDNIGTEASPADFAFVLYGDLTITSQTGERNSLYISSDNITSSYSGTNHSSLILFAEDCDFNVNNAIVTLDNSRSSEDTGVAAVFNNNHTGSIATVNVTGSILNISQSGGKTSSVWIGSDTAGVVKSFLNVTNSTINVSDTTGGFQDAVMRISNSSISMENVTTGFTVAGGSVIDGLTYTVTGATMQGLDLKGDVTITNSTFSITNAGTGANDRPAVMLYNGADVSMDSASSITAVADNNEDANTEVRAVNHYYGGVNASNAMVNPSITGGTINADFGAAPSITGNTMSETETVATTINISGTTIGSSTNSRTVESDVTIVVPYSADTTTTLYVDNSGSVDIRGPVAGSIDNGTDGEVTATPGIDTDNVLAEGSTATTSYNFLTGISETETTYGNGWRYVPSENTLYLTGYNGEGYFYCNTMTRVVVEQNSTITVSQDALDTFGATYFGAIRNDGARSLTVNGPGSLDIEISGMSSTFNATYVAGLFASGVTLNTQLSFGTNTGVVTPDGKTVSAIYTQSVVNINANVDGDVYGGTVTINNATVVGNVSTVSTPGGEISITNGAIQGDIAASSLTLNRASVTPATETGFPDDIAVTISGNAMVPELGSGDTITPNTDATVIVGDYTSTTARVNGVAIIVTGTLTYTPTDSTQITIYNGVPLSVRGGQVYLASGAEIADNEHANDIITVDASNPISGTIVSTVTQANDEILNNGATTVSIVSIGAVDITGLAKNEGVTVYIGSANTTGEGLVGYEGTLVTNDIDGAINGVDMDLAGTGMSILGTVDAGQSVTIDGTDITGAIIGGPVDPDATTPVDAAIYVYNIDAEQMTVYAGSVRITGGLVLNGDDGTTAAIHDLVSEGTDTVTNYGSDLVFEDLEITGEGTISVENLTILGDVTIGSDVEIVVGNGSTLTVDTDAVLGGTGTLTVEDGGVLIVRGTIEDTIDMNVQNSVTVDTIEEFLSALGYYNTINIEGTLNLSITNLEAFGITEVTVENKTVNLGTADSAGAIVVGEGITLNFVGSTVNNVSGSGIRAVPGSTLGIDDSDLYLNVNVDEEATLNLANNVTDITGASTELTNVGFGKVINFSNNYNMASGTQLTVYGTINVNEGYTLTVAANAGISVQEYGSMTVDGTLTVNGSLTVVASDRDNMVVNGTMSVAGTLSGKVANYGTIDFNGTASSATVDMYDGATLNAISVTGVLSVEGASDYTEANRELPAIRNMGTVSLDGVRGLTVTSSEEIVAAVIGGDNAKAAEVTVTLDIAGTVTAGTVTVGHDVYSINDDIVTTIVDVDEVPVTITQTVDLNSRTGIVFEAGEYTIAGILNVNTGATIDNNGEITVTGELSVSAETARALNTALAEIGTVNGAYYVQSVAASGETPASVTRTYTDLATAVAAAPNADDDTVYISGTVEVAADVTVTVPADVKVNSSSGTIEVKGTLTFNDYDASYTTKNTKIEADVMIDADPARTYTSIANAIDSGMTDISLNRDVTITGDVVIPAGTTVSSDRFGVKIGSADMETDASLTVEGALELTGGIGVVIYDSADYDTEFSVAGEDGHAYLPTDATREPVNGNMYDVAGAHYFKDVGTGSRAATVYVISTVMYAADDSANVAQNAVGDYEIVITGAITVDSLTFTAPEDAEVLTVKVQDNIDASSLRFNQIVLGEDVEIVSTNAELTGTVVMQGANGNAVSEIDMTRAVGATVYVHQEEDDTGAMVDCMELSGDIRNGTIVVAIGTVNVGADGLDVFNSNEERFTGSLTVSNGATLNVEKGTLTTNISAVGETALTVDGTVVVNGATMTLWGAVVNGTVTATDDASINVAYAEINGTIETVAVDENDTTSIDVYGPMIVGSKPTDLGVAAGTGTVNGNVNIEDDGSEHYGCIKAYPGADLSGAQIDYVEGVGSDANTTVFNINGIAYMTVYTSDADTFLRVQDLLNNEEFELVGLNAGDNYSATTGMDEDDNTYLYNANQWFSDSNMANNTKLNQNTLIGAYGEIYAHAEPATVYGTVSVGVGLQLYIDDVPYGSSANFPLGVGQHTVRFEVEANYNGDDAVITFNGQTVQNGGTITVEAGATSFSLTATGAVPATPGSGDITVNVPSQDDGMSLTDILLIVLVILIIVMAIIVALRLMRS